MIAFWSDESLGDPEHHKELGGKMCRKGVICDMTNLLVSINDKNIIRHNHHDKLLSTTAFFVSPPCFK
jgi:hypothetical protein